ncbi:methyltransferase domain-containing protein [Streptomyces daliensis]
MTPLADTLQASGEIDPTWHNTFAAIDRAAFLPDRIWLPDADGRYRPIDRTQHPDTWHTAAQADEPVVTHLDTSTGTQIPTSSASKPTVVARMLAALDPQPGHRILEAGTGAGYNTALLAHRCGDHRVVSVEYDPRLADAARHALQAAGHSPLIVTGDAADGHPDRAPYDRIIVTYALPAIPPPLLRQLAPDGILVTPYGTGLYNGVLLRLTATGHGAASGPVIDDTAFMWDRATPIQRDVMAIVHTHPGGTTSRTHLDPRAVLGDRDAAFNAGIHHPGIRYNIGRPDNDSGEFTLWLAHPATNSWAAVDYEPGTAEFDVEQHGPRHLWNEIADAHHWWTNNDSPPRTRYGLTATPHSHHFWLDTSRNVIQ